MRAVSHPRIVSSLAVAVTLAAPPALTAQHGEHAHRLGAVDFEVSCAPDVRSDFDRALGFLHHMMYVEARAAFETVAEKDASCGMAHWGIAMTLFQPLWPTRPSADDLKRGWQEVEMAGAEEPPTGRERALLAAAEAFFREPESGEWWTRIQRWAEAMERAHRAHPQDRETGALYALSRLAIAQTAEDRAPYAAEAAKVLLEIYEQEPTHPGAIHYTIHANDIEGRAEESLDVVRSYAEIAPSVPHALHMPTHIFVRLGAWPEVIEWNRKSADAALEFPAGDAVSHHYPHATDYLVYAYLQRAEDDQAGAVLEETLARGPFQATFISAFHLAAIPARYVIERRAWEEAAALTPRRPADLPWDSFVWPESLTWTARGLGGVHTGDLAAAREAEAKLATLRDRAKEAGERDFERYVEIDRRILAGWIAYAHGEVGEAVALVESAVELERTVEKHPVTPGALLPPGEALGDLLHELGRPREALEAYRASLAIWPGRYNSLLGAARAADTAGEGETAKAYYAELLEKTSGAAERSGLLEARSFLGRAAS